MEELRQAHAARERVFLRDARPDLLDAFVGAVERALQAEPERRFATAGEMEQVLLETLRPEEKPSAPRTSRGARLVAGLGIAALGVLLFFLFLPGRQGPQPEPEASIEAPKPTVFATPSPSLTPRGGLPSADPFVAPLGTPSNEPRTPTVETAYAIDARLEGADLLVRASAAVSVYVFAIDDADQPLLVFPIPGRRPENPLVPGQETRLWIGAAPSRSRLVAVASPARIVGLEAEMARQRVPLASWWGALPLTQPALAHLGSALGFAPRDAGRFLAGAPPLPTHVEMLRGVWIRRLER